jgi:hypothetical protein
MKQKKKKKNETISEFEKVMRETQRDANMLMRCSLCIERGRGGRKGREGRRSCEKEREGEKKTKRKETERGRERGRGKERGKERRKEIGKV